MTAVTISAKVRAPIATVWEKYTRPEHITGWNFASEDWCCPHAEVDLRPGGRHMARMEAKDGSFGFDFEAVYDEVTPPNCLRLTLGDGRKVETRFRFVDGVTHVTTVFDAEDKNPVEYQQQGWQSILDNFGRYVEAG